MPSVEPLTHHVILSSPSLLPLKVAADKRSWIQLARIGSFVSHRYGKFSITKEDLQQMLHNFTSVTPTAPTELPIDWDHLSMEPKKPGDGAAAGWMKQLELRADGDELWAQVEWTARGAEAVDAKEYRFVSPSFVKDHVHKNGKTIGTTLLAAAITNHPFLEGMQSLTLYNFSTMGDLALVDAVPGAQTERALHLAEIDQVVSFIADPELSPELTAEERMQSFRVKARVGEGDDQFVRLTLLDGEEFGWFRSTQLDPAPPQNKENPMANATKTVQMSADEELDALAKEISKQTGKSYSLALIDAGNRRKDLADTRRKEIGVVADEPEADAGVVNNPFNLRRDANESYAALVMRTSREQNIDLRVANQRVAEAFPALAEAYERGEVA